MQGDSSKKVILQVHSNLSRAEGEPDNASKIVGVDFFYLWFFEMREDVLRNGQIQETLTSGKSRMKTRWLHFYPVLHAKNKRNGIWW